MSEPVRAGSAIDAIDPEAVYGRPERLLRAPDRTRAEKLALLEQWAEDATARAVAVAEGMGDQEPERLKEVLDALERMAGEEVTADGPSGAHPGV